MKIGMVCPYSWDVPGGVQQHIRDLAEALIDLGHEVSVISPADDDTPLPDYVVPAGAAMPVPYNGSVARALVRLRLREPGPPLAPGGELRRAARPRARRAEPVAAGLLGGRRADRGHRAHRDAAVTGAAGDAGRDAQPRWRRSTAGSRSPRRPAPRWCSTSAATRCSSRTAWPPAATARRVPLPGWPGPGGAIGFLGRMDEPRKGLAVLLRAFEILAPQRPGLRLLVAGPGDADEALRQVLRRACGTVCTSSARSARTTRCGSCTRSTCSARRTPAASRSAS